MAEKRIRQADLDALKGEVQLYVHKEIERYVWMVLKIFAVPLIGATVKVLEILKDAVQRLPQ